MERRKFLQNIFGAAIVAAIPKIVVKEIEKFAPPEILTPTPNIIKEYADKILYVFDDNKLIGASTEFSLNLKPNYIDVTTHEDFIKTGWKKYIKGLTEWHVLCSKMQWVDHLRGLDYFHKDKPFQIVFKYNEVRLHGDAYLTECQLTAPMYEEIDEDVVLQGTGSLIKQA